MLGARNLGGAIIDHFLARGWNAAGVARSEDTLARCAIAARWRCRPTHPIRSRCAARWPRARGVRIARRGGQRGERGPSAPSGGPFGGGELGSADLDAFRGWTVAVAEQAFVFLSDGAAALRESGGGALVQITGGSSRRAMPGRGLWAAGAFATRALVQAAAQELRAGGIHVALLAVDATIESPKTEAFTRDPRGRRWPTWARWRGRSRTSSSRGRGRSPTSWW